MFARICYSVLIILFSVPDAAPFITRVTPTSHNSIRVTWRPIPKHQRNGIIQGYHIYYSQYARDEWKLYTTPTGNITSWVVPGLKPLTWYCVKMSAFTRKGEYQDWNETSCRYLKSNFQKNWKLIIDIRATTLYRILEIQHSLAAM